MAEKYWGANADSMNDEQLDMKFLADHVEDRAQYSDLDKPTQEQFTTLIGGAMKHIFNSQDNHFGGRYKAAHSNLKVAAKHISDAARLVDGVNGGRGSTDWKTAMHPSDYAEQLTMSYKHGYEV
jgi:hypothetical protein